MIQLTKGGVTKVVLARDAAYWKSDGWVLDMDADAVADNLGLVPTGVKGDGTTDDTAAIQAAIDVVYAAGGGAVLLPLGTYKLTTALVPKDRVSVVGAGRGTIIKPTGLINAFAVSRSVGSPLVDATFQGFTIDGSDQAGTYSSSSLKGIYVTYLSRCVFRDLYIAHTGATGLGVDYLSDVVIDSVVAYDCGRLNDGTQPGGAGIGVGTGQSAVESFVISNCHAISNKRFGVLLESQTSTASKGGRIVNCYAEGNVHGFVDAGMSGLVMSGCVSVGNTKNGFSINAGTLSPICGQDGLMVGCIARDNVEHGFHFDLNSSPSAGNYSFLNCESLNNTKSGFNLETQNTRAMKGLTVKGCTIQGNGSLGVRVVGTGGAVSDIDIIANTINANGQLNGTGFTQGIRLDTSCSRVKITSNRCFDNGGTKKQTYGFQLASTFTLTDGDISTNDFRNNLTGAVSIAGTLTTCSVGDNPGWTVGAGSPESVVVAPIGTIYRRTDGGAATSIYVKESGSSSTGWVAK